jgi:hypothetical protein
MMHCVPSNKSSLFAPTLKILKKQGKDKYPCEPNFVLECSWNEKH